MRAVWKFDLEDGPVLRLPVGATVLTAQSQAGRLCLWAVVDPEAAREDRKVHVIGTGQPVPEDVQYVGTVQEGPFVWHVFV